MSATLQTATLATLIQFNMWSMPSQIKLQVSLQSNYFNLLLVHRGHSKSLFGWNRTSQTSMAAVTSTSRSMRYQLPVNNCLQNRASLSNFPIKFAKIKPMNSAQHICEHSRVLGQWLELVIGHMSYVSQSECQKILAVRWTLEAPSFGRFYIFFIQSSLLFQDFMAFRPPKCTLSFYQDQGMDRQDIRLPEASSSRIRKSRTSRKYLRGNIYKSDPKGLD